jgi:ABC-type transport system involved in multi-copper enzyme maturation permease subunit
MIRGLVEKEYRQHSKVAVLILLAMVVGQLALTVNKFVHDKGGSSFSLLSELWFYIVPLVALVLGTALVATEFRNRTQLFLEGLPMPRWMLLTVKYLLGLGIVLLCTASLLAGAWLIGRNAEAMSVNFCLLLFVKSMAWAWFCWAVCFAHGFLGKYRGWTGVLLISGLILLQSMGIVPVTHFGPFELISERFAYERFVWPVATLWITATLIMTMTLAGFAFGLIRDGTVAAMFSEKMSMREKIVFTIMAFAAFLGVVMFKIQVDSEKPLNLPGSVDFKRGAAMVFVAAAVTDPTPEEQQALTAHATAAGEMLEQVGIYLECESLPRVYLIHRRDLDTDIESRISPRRVEMRINLLKHHPEDAVLQERILHSMLTAHQCNRLDSDTRGWLLQGFSVWWPVRAVAKTPAEFIKLPRHGEKPMVRTLCRWDLENWLKTKGRMTESEHKTSAGLAMIVLGDYGEESRRRFLATILGYSAPKNASATLHDWFHPVGSTLKSTTGSDLSSFAQKWTTAIQTEEAKP